MVLSQVFLVVLAIFVVVYSLAVFFWLLETTLLASSTFADESDFKWQNTDIQVRIMTINSEDVVQSTVDAIPENMAGIHVVAEEAIEVSGATVHVVPEEFECNASYKGRALEWARRNIPCDVEYVLHLDEDTLVANLNGLPEADIIQFTEVPMYTGSKIAYLCEIYREGFMFEQKAFSTLRYPLYLWGGGFAVRHSLEQDITWERHSVTEDTNFVWTAAATGPLSIQVVDARFRNQAPPSLKSLLKQRRRWMSGTWQDMKILPPSYRILLWGRIILWSLSPIALLLPFTVLIFPEAIAVIPFYGAISLLLFIYLFYVTGLGASVYELDYLSLVVALLFTPLAVIITAIGAIWAIFSPVSTFSVTEKVTFDTIKEKNEGLSEEALEEHTGTGELNTNSNLISNIHSDDED